MPLHTIKLEVIPGAWRLFVARKRDPVFEEFSKQVFERDGYTCQFCGFQARQHQEVVNLDRNYRNNRLPNLMTACCFCAQCFFLESAGKDEYGGGTLIYLPEVTQPELNGFCHVLFCAMTNATAYYGDAQVIYRNLKMRSKVVEDQIGEGMSDPATLGQVLIDAQIEQRDAVGEALLKDMRLLSSHVRFTPQIEAWAKAALEEMSPQ